MKQIHSAGRIQGLNILKQVIYWQLGFKGLTSTKSHDVTSSNHQP
jgi:hypothetical protein